jgi:uncharacterized protein (TIRG00374 family)
VSVLPESDARPRRRRPRWRDPQVLLGVAITVATLWLALRGVDLRQLLREMGRANLPLLLGLSFPIYAANLWVRALRWRYLTDAVCPIARGPLFRATSVGAIVNNVLPLRLGEVARAFYLARETGGNRGSLFGTVVLERGIDGIAVLVLALAAFGVQGHRGAGSLSIGLPLFVAAVVPFATVVWLRVAPEQVVAALRAVFRLTGGRGASAVERLVRHIAEGLGSLQGGRHLWWVGWHTVVIWTVLGVAPFLITMAAVGVDVGSPLRNLEAAFVTLAAVGVAVALPSAPGFLGPYHLAARVALRRFGVSDELALAVGTLSHAVFWVATNAIGLLVLRFRGAGLDEIAEAAAEVDQVPSVDRR